MTDEIQPVETLSEIEASSVITVWQQTIQTQMHFNEIEMKIRNVFITVTLAIFAGIGWSIEKDFRANFGEMSVSLGTLATILVFSSAYLFYFIDRYWYHQLLKASVEQGLILDKVYGKRLRALGLTSSISGGSPIIGFRKKWYGRLFNLIISPSDESPRSTDDPRPKEGKEDLHSNAKIELIYKSVAWLTLVGGIVSLFLGGVSLEPEQGEEKINRIEFSIQYSNMQ